MIGSSSRTHIRIGTRARTQMWAKLQISAWTRARTRVQGVGVRVLVGRTDHELRPEEKQLFITPIPTLAFALALALVFAFKVFPALTGHVIVAVVVIAIAVSEVVVAVVVAIEIVATAVVAVVIAAVVVDVQHGEVFPQTLAHDQ